MNPLFLTFQQWSWEIPFLKQPDPLFKFYISCALFVLIFMGLIYLVPTLSLSKYVSFIRCLINDIIELKTFVKSYQFLDGIRAQRLVILQQCYF